MADDPITIARRVMRTITEAAYVNTLNLGDQISVDFVWYPGEANAASDSLVDVLLPLQAGQPERVINYQWASTGQQAFTRPMLGGRITLPLPPGGSGILTVFDTTWQISRHPAGTTMTAVNTVTGLQERLNRLGYHLRAPGAVAAGVDGALGRRTERAVLQFQCDYRPPAGAAGGAANRQLWRGEWTANGELTNVNITGPNSSATDGANTQAALVAAAGG